MLEVLSRFNVTTYGPLLSAINGIVAANLVRGNEMGEKKNTIDRLRVLVGRGKVRRERILFYTADMPYQRGKWSTLA